MDTQMDTGTEKAPNTRGEEKHSWGIAFVAA
jgi:hypothetical protein